MTRSSNVAYYLLHKLSDHQICQFVAHWAILKLVYNQNLAFGNLAFFGLLSYLTKNKFRTRFKLVLRFGTTSNIKSKNVIVKKLPKPGFNTVFKGGSFFGCFWQKLVYFIVNLLAALFDRTAIKQLLNTEHSKAMFEWRATMFE